MLNLAAKRGLVTKAPAISLLEENRRTLLVEPDAEQRIADELTRPGRRRGSLKTALYMILDAGMRPKEICSMRIEDVNFERGFVYVPKSKTRAGARFLALTDRMKEKLFAQIGARTEGYVFPSPRFDGSPIKSQAWTAAWRKAARPRRLARFETLLRPSHVRNRCNERLEKSLRCDEGYGSHRATDYRTLPASRYTLS